MYKQIIRKIWILVTFIRNKESLPTSTNIAHPKMQYEIMSGAFIWEDEGLWECKNQQLMEAFKYVINHRMKLIVGPNNEVEYMHSYDFDKQIYDLAKRFFPKWIGFDQSRCSYNKDLAKRIMRIHKVADWRLNRAINE